MDVARICVHFSVDVWMYEFISIYLSIYGCVSAGPPLLFPRMVRMPPHIVYKGLLCYILLPYTWLFPSPRGRDSPLSPVLCHRSGNCPCAIASSNGAYGICRLLYSAGLLHGAYVVCYILLPYTCLFGLVRPYSMVLSQYMLSC